MISGRVAVWVVSLKTSAITGDFFGVNTSTVGVASGSPHSGPPGTLGVPGSTVIVHWPLRFTGPETHRSSTTRTCGVKPWEGAGGFTTCGVTLKVTVSPATAVGSPASKPGRSLPSGSCTLVTTWLIAACGSVGHTICTAPSTLPSSPVPSRPCSRSRATGPSVPWTRPVFTSAGTVSEYQPAPSASATGSAPSANTTRTARAFAGGFAPVTQPAFEAADAEASVTLDDHCWV